MFLDFRNAPFLGAEQFYDRMHLNVEGAAIYSRRLGRAIRVTARRSLKLDPDF
jgi:hypothetical protein